MITGVYVRLNADDDAMVGADGWGEYDATESTAKFCQEIADELKSMYPDAETVTVTPEDSLMDTRVEFEYDSEDDETLAEEQAVKDRIGVLWQRWDWLVPA